MAKQGPIFNESARRIIQKVRAIGGSVNRQSGTINVRGIDRRKIGPTLLSELEWLSRNGWTIYS